MDLTTSLNILGLDPTADEASAKHAYKAQVRRWHPDQFPEGSPTKAGAEEQLKQINIAYARVKAHLAFVRPEPKAAPPPPRQPQGSAPQNDNPGQKPEKRSWVDHLFDTLNAFGGNHDAKRDPAPADASHASRRKTFGQVLDEMAGGNISSRPGRPGRRSRKPGAVPSRSAGGYGGCRRRGGTVGAVGGAERPGPVRPVHRVRGIGRSR
ncbi:hypothetical protein DSCA_13010 [Desulfosarcina alkanivorans]|uniref:J domain-containing protein n=1 Tax=Desulfosarcina alkanivorans TaxID=571177 RepID=A0A5K7YKM5_9BACT|nr:J domain-containing protein [Desulfosarcina alkanivorans]BBO67371.1 hypothetical protein DSCA_13010 [Desulfosarcina alkanivorans]